MAKIKICSGNLFVYFLFHETKEHQIAKKPQNCACQLWYTYFLVRESSSLAVHQNAKLFRAAKILRRYLCLGTSQKKIQQCKDSHNQIQLSFQTSLVCYIDCCSFCTIKCVVVHDSRQKHFHLRAASTSYRIFKSMLLSNSCTLQKRRNVSIPSK